MQGDVVARCHHVIILFGLDDARNTLAVKSLNTPCELEVSSFILMTIGIALSYCVHNTWNYRGNKSVKITQTCFKFQFIKRASVHKNTFCDVRCFFLLHNCTFFAHIDVFNIYLQCRTF